MIITSSNINYVKIEPYELCPCDSGNKFKFCCFEKARNHKQKSKIDSTYTDARINHIIKQFWETTDFKTCLGFIKEECEGDIKSAHSIQNNRILNRISKNGHVFKIETKGTRDGSQSTLEKISKNKASTFFGFCDKHDTELFRDIEVKGYIGSPIQDFLFAFRAHSIEHHKKIRQLQTTKNLFKEIPSAMVNPDSVYPYRVAQLDVRDHQLDYSYFREHFLMGEYNVVKTIRYTLNYEVRFSASSSFTVKHDLNGKTLNDIHGLGIEKMPSIFLNVFPAEGKTHILISYLLADEAIYKEYFEQIRILPEKELLNYLNFLIIEYTENVFFDPDFIGEMSQKQKDSLLRSFESSIYLLEKLFLIEEENYFEFNLFDNKMIINP
ncbi:hypothetical protein Q9R46_14595 [Paenibacillus sp. RRE4]|uniref:hypothetical protein n=1 Tax=Paenibacillus sp. RRE4 TaxID=2962587 RepID=UPI002881361F|nr:hypothetical protein [Paenibacillus sp. RRE4]MDT0123887.1 hypothetical protein [Paenibacillus sp. RRE4]